MTNSSDRYGSNTGNSWSYREWFSFLVVILLLWTALYVFLHSEYGIKGYRTTGFTTGDIRHVNSILTYNVDGPAGKGTGSISARPSMGGVDAGNDGFLDTYDIDTENVARPVTELPAFSTVQVNEEEVFNNRIKKAMVYISSQYSNDLEPQQLLIIEEYIRTFSPREVGIFLADYKLRTKSFFWLTGRMLYAEVVFWVIFGVICSLLFYIGNALRKGNAGDSFSTKNIIFQVARLFYAPFAAIIIILAYSYLKGGSSAGIEAGEGIIVFGFIIGLYSGTVMELLDRARYVVINTNGNHTAPEPVYTSPNVQAPKAAPAPQQEAPRSVPADEPVQEEQYAAEERHQQPAPPPVPGNALRDRKRSLTEDNEISEVDIDLKLDFSGLFDEERSELQRMGFSKAIVTLHNVNGKDIIPAQKFSEGLNTFVARDVKPGIYIARATLSQRLKDNQIINLFGEKTAYVTEDKPGLELYVKKYEAIG